MQHFYSKHGPNVTIAQLLKWVRDHPLSDGRCIPVIFWGGAGIGKTQMIRSYAKQNNLLMKQYHPAHETSGADIVGRQYTDPETNKTKIALPDWLPTDPDSHGVLFIDEINRGNDQVLAGLMEVLGEGAISQSGWKLPKGWQIVCAANPPEVGYEVQDLDEAMINRMVHYAPGWDAAYWAAWAVETGLPEQVIDFVLRSKEKSVDIGEEQLPLDIDNKLRASPRSFEYVAALYEPGMHEGLLEVIATGMLGRNVGEQFTQMLRSFEDNEQQRNLFIENLKSQGQIVNPLYNLQRPLRAEEILTWPSKDPISGQYLFNYEEPLSQWIKDNNADTQELITASITRMIGALVYQQPASQDPTQEPTAQMAGRFLACLPAGMRELGLDEISRSLYDWTDVINACTQIWVQRFNDQGRHPGIHQPSMQPPAPQPALNPPESQPALNPPEPRYIESPPAIIPPNQ